MMSTISENDIDDDFKRLHSCANQFLSQLMSVSFSICSEDLTIEGISSSTDAFGISASGNSGSVHEYYDWDDDED